MKRFRFLLSAAISMPFIASLVFYYVFTGKPTGSVYIIGSIALLLELIFLREVDHQGKSDTGMLSGFVISIVLSLMCFFISQNPPSLVLQFIATFVTILGIVLRTYSKITLGKYFSHSLRVMEDHQLIKIGLLQIIRHPAYTGTILMVTGFSLYMNWVLAVMLLILTTILALKRIKNEEMMLLNKFGAEYEKYICHSWKLFPLVI